MTDEKPRLPPGSPCTNCGKCCTNPSFMGSLEATGDDVKRWRRQRRHAILRFAEIMGPPEDPFGWTGVAAWNASGARSCAKCSVSRAISVRFTKPDRRSAAIMNRGLPTRSARSSDDYRRGSPSNVPAMRRMKPFRLKCRPR